MKKFLAVVSSMLLVGAVQAYAADATVPNIAVVNVQQLFQQSPKIANINKQLQAEFKGRQDKLVAQQKSLQDQVDKYKKDEATMSQKDKDSMQKKIAADQASLSKDATAFQDDLNKEQSKQMKNVLAQLNQIISNLAKKSSYSMVFDSQAVIFAVDGTDITKQVSKEFDSK